MALFKTENLTFRYPGSDGNALNEINIEIGRGEFILVMGGTGSGKSTLLRLLAPAVSPYGKISGNIINNSDSAGFVAQNTDASFVSETVRGELAFSLENQRLDNNKIALKIGETASFFNLTKLLDRKISTLSGGEKAVTAIASAMINDADAIILDEPTAQLDSKSAFDLINILKRVNSELGVTVIMSTHLSDGVIEMCDRLLVLDNGRAVFFENPVNVNERVLPFYPLSARLFKERPLSVKQAVKYAAALKEKPMENSGDIGISEADVILKNITFAYDRGEKDVLDGLSFNAYSKKIHCVIGANGSGKTTLLKIIAGIRKPYSGKVKVKGRVAYLPQNPRYLFTRDTVGEEIDRQTAALFGLDEFSDRHPYDLSTGQMQKLALALLSCQSYDILLLDEPSKGLDVFFKSELTRYLKSLNKTVIIVSHDLDFVGDVADFVSFLSDGAMTAAGGRRKVLSSLGYYTTQLRRITKRYLASAVSAEDLL